MAHNQPSAATHLNDQCLDLDAIHVARWNPTDFENFMQREHRSLHCVHVP